MSNHGDDRSSSHKWGRGDVDHDLPACTSNLGPMSSCVRSAKCLSLRARHREQYQPEVQTSQAKGTPTLMPQGRRNLRLLKYPYYFGCILTLPVVLRFKP